MINSNVASDLFKRAIHNVGDSILLDYDSPIGEGHTFSNDNYVNLAYVGADKLKSQSEISDYDFMAGLVSIYHENRHVEQLRAIHENDDEYLEPLKYSYYAGQCCHDYVNDNYFNSPREVEAELYGMRLAYVDCIDYFGQEKANDLLCNYINTKIRSNTSFIHGHYYDADDIFVDMSMAYEDFIYTKRKYKNEPCKNGINFAKSELDAYPNMLHALQTENVGWKQDRMLASIYLNQKQNEYLRMYCRGLACLNLDKNEAFQLSEFRDRMKNRLNIRENRGQDASGLLDRVLSYEYHNDDMEFE